MSGIGKDAAAQKLSTIKDFALTNAIKHQQDLQEAEAQRKENNKTELQGMLNGMQNFELPNDITKIDYALSDIGGIFNYAYYNDYDTSQLTNQMYNLRKFQGQAEERKRQLLLGDESSKRQTFSTDFKAFNG